MTTGNDEVIEQSAEEVAAAEKAAEASFAAGFSKVRGEEPADPVVVPDATTTEAAAATAAEPAKTEAKTDETTQQSAPADAGTGTPAAAAQAPGQDEWRKGLEDRVTKAEQVAKEAQGRTSALQSALDTAKAAAKRGEEAPSAAEIATAIESDADWKELQESFPQWARLQVKREAAITASLRAEFSKASPAVDTEGITKAATTAATTAAVAQANSIATAARRLAQVDLAHEGWEEKVASPEFDTWLKTQPPEVQALEKSARPKDAIAMLDKYAADTKAAAVAEATRAKKDKRLEAAITPRGSPQAAPSAQTEEEQFNKGFKRVAKQRGN